MDNPGWSAPDDARLHGEDYRQGPSRVVPLDTGPIRIVSDCSARDGLGVTISEVPTHLSDTEAWALVEAITVVLGEASRPVGLDGTAQQR